MSDADELADFYRFLAEAEFDGYCDLYARLARATADDPALLASIATMAPATKVLPVLLFAAVHHLVLAAPDSELAACYRGDDGAPPTRGPPTAPSSTDRFDELAELVATRTIQTNEVGRSSVLLPALTAVHRRFDRPLTLVELGPSAGLNLFFDRFGYRYDDGVVLGDPDAGVQLECAVVGDTVAASRPRRPRRSWPAWASTSHRSTSPIPRPAAGSRPASGPASPIARAGSEPPSSWPARTHRTSRRGNALDLLARRRRRDRPRHRRVPHRHLGAGLLLPRAARRAGCAPRRARRRARPRDRLRASTRASPPASTAPLVTPTSPRPRAPASSGWRRGSDGRREAGADRLVPRPRDLARLARSGDVRRRPGVIRAGIGAARPDRQRTATQASPRSSVGDRKLEVPHRSGGLNGSSDSVSRCEPVVTPRTSRRAKPSRSDWTAAHRVHYGSVTTQVSSPAGTDSTRRRNHHGRCERDFSPHRTSAGAEPPPVRLLAHVAEWTDPRVPGRLPLLGSLGGRARGRRARALARLSGPADLR